MPALRRHRWTIDEVDRLVDERPAYTPRYELVDGDTQTFEIWHPGNPRSSLVDGRFTWQPTGAGAGLEIDVAAFVAEVADEPR